MPYAAFYPTEAVLAANEARQTLVTARARVASLRRDLAAAEEEVARLQREVGERLATVTAAGHVA